MAQLTQWLNKHCLPLLCDSHCDVDWKSNEVEAECDKSIHSRRITMLIILNAVIKYLFLYSSVRVEQCVLNR